MYKFRKAAVLVAGLLISAHLWGCTTGNSQTEQFPDSAPRYGSSSDGHLLLGDPSVSGADENNFRIMRPQYALSYNRANGTANWVSWHVDSSDLGRSGRGDFEPDPLLPPAWAIRPTDYRGSGYDRGHICPSGDRTRSRADNDATFYMSNMLPQAAALNQHVWRDLEEYARALLKKNELYVVSGGSGSAGRIAKGKVNVPDVCWKIILVLPRGKNDLARITADTRVIAVSIPNRERPEIEESRWADWITTVDHIEKTTGLDFFTALPEHLEPLLESQKDSGRADRTPRSQWD